MSDRAPWELHDPVFGSAETVAGPFTGLQQEESDGPALVLLWVVVLGLASLGLLSEGGPQYNAGLVLGGLAAGFGGLAVMIGFRPQVEELRVRSSGVELRFSGRRWPGNYFAPWRKIRPVRLDRPGERTARAGSLGWVHSPSTSSGGIGPTLARHPRSLFWLMVPDPRFPRLGPIWIGLDPPSLSAAQRYVQFGTYRRSDDDWGGRPTWAPVRSEP